MTREQRTVTTASFALMVIAVGTFLPWARIGGRARSGFATADTFIVLSEGVLPDRLAWIGRWWYAPAFLGVVAWASVFAGGRSVTRIAGVGLVAISLAMWWTFVWAGWHWQIIEIQMIGPTVATAGMALLAGCCTQPRSSWFPPRNP